MAGGDMRRAVERLEVPEFVMPEDPAKDATETEREIWKVEVKEFVHKRRSIRENLKMLYSLAWGQCTDIMRQKIEALDNHEQMATESDGLGLLRAIKNASFNFQSQKYVAHALHDAKRRFYLCSQSKHMTTQAYLEAFRGTLDVIEHTGGEIRHEPGIERYVAEQNAIDYDNMDDDKEEDVKREGKERYLAVAFLLGSDRSRFGRLLENLENNFLQGQNNYPATVTAAYSLLTNWKQDPRNLMRPIGPVNDGVRLRMLMMATTMAMLPWPMMAKPRAAATTTAIRRRTSLTSFASAVVRPATTPINAMVNARQVEQISSGTASNRASLTPMIISSSYSMIPVPHCRLAMMDASQRLGSSWTTSRRLMCLVMVRSSRTFVKTKHRWIFTAMPA
jgi:hypothetical protein